MVKKIEYSWQDFDKDVETIIKYINKKSNKKKHIVTLYRGGLPLGVTLSNKCNSPLSIIDYQRLDGNSENPKPIFIINKIKDGDHIFLVDDIYDTGKSMNESYKFLSLKYPNSDIEGITLVGSGNQFFYTTQHKEDWIKFPWE